MKPRRWVKTFMPEFAPLVRDGRKRQTVRRIPKNGKLPRVGDIMDARRWTGAAYRSEQEHLTEGEITRVALITISEKGIVIGTEILDAEQAEEFARADGFENAAALRLWFTKTHKGLPFSGYVTFWKPV